MKCQAGNDCSNEAATYPEMPQMLYGAVCKFHWYVWQYENGSVTVPFNEDFTMEDVEKEANLNKKNGESE